MSKIRLRPAWHS